MAVDWTRWQDAQQEVKQCLHSEHSGQGTWLLTLSWVARYPGIPGIRPERADPPGNRGCKSCNPQTFDIQNCNSPALKRDTNFVSGSATPRYPPLLRENMPFNLHKKKCRAYCLHMQHTVLSCRLWGRCSKDEQGHCLAWGSSRMWKTESTSNSRTLNEVLHCTYHKT